MVVTTRTSFSIFLSSGLTDNQLSSYLPNAALKNKLLVGHLKYFLLDIISKAR